MTTLSLKSRIGNSRKCIFTVIQTGLVSKRRSEIKTATAAAIADIDITLSQIPKFKNPKIKKSLRVLSTTLQGLVHGIEQNDLDLKGVRGVVRRVESKFYPAVKEAIALEDESLSAFDDAQEQLRSETEQVDKSVDDDDDDTAETINLQHRNSVKALLSKSSSMQEALQVVKDALNLERKRREDQINNGPAAGPSVEQDSPPDFSDRGTGDNLSVADQNIVKQLKDIQDLYKQLPNTTTGAYAVVRAPIVPIFSNDKKNFNYPTAGRAEVPHRESKNFTMGYKLKQLGVPHLSLHGYVILSSQLLLAVKRDAIAGIEQQLDNKAAAKHKVKMDDKRLNRSNLSKALKKLEAEEEALEAEKDILSKKKKLGTISQSRMVVIKKRLLGLVSDIKALHGRLEEIKSNKPKKAQVHLEPDDLAKLLLEVINEKSHNDYVLVTRHATPNPRNTKILFFWIMPSRILRVLQQSGWANVKNWGFPFGAVQHNED